MTILGDEVLTLREVAMILKCSRGIVERLVKNGDLPALKFGAQWRVLKSVLATFLENSRFPRKEDAGHLISAKRGL